MADPEDERLTWLAGVAPAPRPQTPHLPDSFTSAADGHPMGPEALVEALAGALRALHDRPVDDCPFRADTATLRQVVDDRLAADRVTVAATGPYAGRPGAQLAAIFDELLADLGETTAPVVIHGHLAADRVWLDPSGDVRFTGWRHAGRGDRHVDLAAAAGILSALHGPALVGPFFEAYGFDHVDLRRLDAHQILAHLLA